MSCSIPDSPFWSNTVNALSEKIKLSQQNKVTSSSSSSSSSWLPDSYAFSSNSKFSANLLAPPSDEKQVQGQCSVKSPSSSLEQEQQSPSSFCSCATTSSDADATSPACPASPPSSSAASSSATPTTAHKKRKKKHGRKRRVEHKREAEKISNTEPEKDVKKEEPKEEEKAADQASSLVPADASCDSDNSGESFNWSVLTEQILSVGYDQSTLDATALPFSEIQGRLSESLHSMLSPTASGHPMDTDTVNSLFQSLTNHAFVRRLVSTVAHDSGHKFDLLDFVHRNGISAAFQE